MSVPANQPLTIAALLAGYRSGAFDVRELLAELDAREARLAPPGVWIHRLTVDERECFVERLDGRSPSDLPLYGIPFAIKDNIDLAGIPTTAACAEFAFTPDSDAAVVARLIDAGAIPVGKTNLDQFATGLNGTRSPAPWGPCANAFDREYISGGSSSGSAVAVALGLASFSLGTDTAGSGRVPAAFNNLVGLKPTRGVLSSRGMLPACRTLDTITIFGLSAGDVAAVFEQAQAVDSADAYARPLIDSRYPGFHRHAPLRVAIPQPEQLDFGGCADHAAAYAAAVERLRAMGAELVEWDFAPLLEAAQLLYEGPWVAERYAAIREFIETSAQAIHPVVRGIIEPGIRRTAVDTFAAMYRLKDYRRKAEALFDSFDLALSPTAPKIYTLAQMLAEPVTCNSHLGVYTNFMNLLDLAAIALPGPFLPSGLPSGFTVFGPAGCDRALLQLAGDYLDASAPPLGATGLARPPEQVHTVDSGDWQTLVVCGAHMDGLPLNGQLTGRGGVRLASTTTAPGYRLYALPGGPPQRPALVRDDACSSRIAVELWALPAASMGSFLSGIPAPLALGKVQLADDGWYTGFVAEARATEGACEITSHGGWRAWLDAS
ncbi:allophanate hydrolase [Mangrovimicrobium sediminis]|uniref:Allophanate hydrolase n=1 Tax=Mangrovimicrobium sediminis TaxID=2562682 RepID=A0A4Z0M557_9GAMM|nr:allophanate hydrolase [Haliea sp. SAOS-164]TGD74629.1 allophanate hydrolase [Haliea sp. SAOS-164]